MVRFHLSLSRYTGGANSPQSVFTLLMAAFCIFLATPISWSMPARLGQAVPADALAVLYFDPTSQGSHANGVSLLNMIGLVLERGRELGILPRVDQRTRLLLDGLGSLPVIVSQPCTVMLLDVAARPRPDGGTELDHLSMALVMLNKGKNEAVTQRLQQLLNIHTDSALSRLEQVPTAQGLSYRLTDSRLPDWAVLQWGGIADCYVVALGSKAFAKVSSALDQAGNTADAAPSVAGVSGTRSDTSLATDPWFASAHASSGGADGYLQVYTDVDGLLRRLSGSADQRARLVLSAMGLQNIQQGLWTVRRQGRAVEIVSVHRAGGADRRVPWTTTDLAPLALEDVVPPSAESYMVLGGGAREFILRARDAYLAMLRPGERQVIVDGWKAEEAKVGVSFDKDLLAQLGDRVVLHTDPPHPLRIPFLCSVLIEIQGSANSIRRCLDVTIRRINELFPCELPGMTVDGSWLRRGDDGIWYVQFGLVGPALAVTDGWIVIGYSPQAVRHNLKYLESRKTMAAPSVQPNAVGDRS